MNSSAISFISEQGVDISMLMDQCDFMDPFDEQDSAMAAPNYGGHDDEDDDNLFQNYLLSSSSSTLQIHTNPQIMQPHNYSNFSTIHNNNMGILNFGNHNPCHQQINPVDQEIVVPPRVLKAPTKYNESSEETTRVPPTKKKRIRPPAQTYEHIMAERRRREQLSQLFVALSALIPGLKKMDKGSILEDAIKYTKELKERVKVLEEKSERKAMESVVVVKKSQIVDEDDEVSSNVQSSTYDEQMSSLPEVEVKVNENQILVKVLCEKQKDALTKLISKVESLNMMVVSTNATAFGNVTLDITIVAEMEKEFNLSVKEVVRALREALQADA